MVSTSKHPARSTCSAFVINPVTNLVGDCSEALSGVRFVFLDEYSFINCLHLQHISRSIRKAEGMSDDCGHCFANMHVVLCGDLCQHRPVRGHPLFINNAEREACNRLRSNLTAATGAKALLDMSPEETTGSNAYLTFDRVVFLTEQQRILAEGDLLYRYSRMFMAAERPPKAVVAEFCDALNAKVVTPDLLQQWAAAGKMPRAVCLRNDVRMQLNWTFG